MTANERQRVLILGAGFGGLYTALHLLNLVGWQNRVQVALNWILALLFPTVSAVSHECPPECGGERCPRDLTKPNPANQSP